MHLPVTPFERKNPAVNYFIPLPALFLLLVLNSSVHAQNYSIPWQYSFGGSNDEVCYRMQQTADSGYMCVGLTWSQDGDVSDALYIRQALLIKFDKAGNLQWEKTYGGSETDHSFYTEQTHDHGYIMAMESQSDDGDVPVNYGWQDLVVFKLDEGGNIVWTRVIGGSLHDHPCCIRQIADGYIFAGASLSNDGDVSGHHGSSQYFDIWVVKMDTSGNIIWSKSIGGSLTEFARYIQPTPDGGYVLTGESYSNDGDISGHHGTSETSDMVVIKIDGGGNVVWQKCFGGSGNDIGHDLVLTPDGGIMVIGATESSDGDVTYIHGSYDYWMVKLDSAGNLMWQKTLGGSQSDYSRSIQISKEGGFVIGGETSSNDGDVGDNKGISDFWLVRTDSLGNILWSTTLGGSAIDDGNAFTQIADGNYVVAGTFDSDDGDVLSHHGTTDYSDVWVAKVVEGTEEGIQETNPVSLPFTVFPNPADASTTIYFTMDNNNGVQLQLLNSESQVIESRRYDVTKSGKQNIELSTSSLAPGIYFVRLISGDAISQKLFVVAR